MCIAADCFAQISVGSMNPIGFFPFRVPNMAFWGSAGGVALVYFTDWRLFLDYVPYIRGKFKDD